MLEYTPEKNPEKLEECCTKQVWIWKYVHTNALLKNGDSNMDKNKNREIENRESVRVFLSNIFQTNRYSTKYRKDIVPEIKKEMTLCVGILSILLQQQ